MCPIEPIEVSAGSDTLLYWFIKVDGRQIFANIIVRSIIELSCLRRFVVDGIEGPLSSPAASNPFLIG